MLQFIIRACKYYYPSCVTSMLIVEIPGILKASWMLLRTRSSPDMQHLIQPVTRISLSSFIPLIYIPIRYGGQVKESVSKSS